MITREDLHGSWQVVSWEQRYDDGRVVRPMGENPVGGLTYVGDRMVALLSRADREPFRTGGQWDASEEEKAGAYAETLAYSGSFDVEGDVEGDTVVHRVEVSIFPNWVGLDQRRRLSLDGDRLVESGRIEEGTSEARTVELTFQRTR